MIGDIFDHVRKERKAHEFLLPQLLEKLQSQRDVDLPGPNDWLSASKVPLWCPRHHVICHRLKARMYSADDAQGRWRMDRGTAMHIVVQEMWLGPRGWLKGGWKCCECARVHTSDMAPEVTISNSIRMPSSCIECGFEPNHFDRFGYEEPWVKDDIARVRGRIDGLLAMPVCAEEVLDIKVTSSFKWEARQGVPGDRSYDLREAPHQHHVTQLHWYMGPEKIRRGRLLYIDPGAKRLDRAIVEHRVEFDPKLFHAEREKIRGLREALKDPSRPVPACPHGRRSPFGDCACVEVEDVWVGDGG